MNPRTKINSAVEFGIAAASTVSSIRGIAIWVAKVALNSFWAVSHLLVGLASSYGILCISAALLLSETYKLDAPYHANMKQFIISL